MAGATWRLGRRFWAAVTMGGVLLAGGAIIAVGTAAADPNVAVVQTVAAETLMLEQRMGVPNPGMKGGALSDSDVATLRTNANALVKAHFSGPLLATRPDQFRNAVDGIVNGTSPYVDAGTKDIVFGKTVVGTDTATVHLRATTWAHISVRGLDSIPTATLNWTFTLEKVAGRWFVTDETSDFHG
jgi:hypothetical protein